MLFGVGLEWIVFSALIWAISLAACCAFGYATMTIAGKKGYSRGGFFAIGFFLGVVGLVIALVLSDKTAAKENGSNLDSLVKYKSLLDEGVITQEEFDAQKAVVLKEDKEQPPSWRPKPGATRRFAVTVLSLVSAIALLLFALYILVLLIGIIGRSMSIVSAVFGGAVLGALICLVWSVALAVNSLRGKRPFSKISIVLFIIILILSAILFLAACSFVWSYLWFAAIVGCLGLVLLLIAGILAKGLPKDEGNQLTAEV